MSSGSGVYSYGATGNANDRNRRDQGASNAGGGFFGSGIVGGGGDGGGGGIGRPSAPDFKAFEGTGNKLGAA